MRKETGFKGSGFITNLKKYLAGNATALKITTVNPKGLEPDRSYVIKGSASRDSIAAILRFISEDTTSTKASHHTRILQPDYSQGDLAFLKNGRKLPDIGMGYEVLSGGEIGTVECTYHNRRYLQLLTKEGNEYFYGK
jgi:hypothetical protein